jgi:hypothetical protein
LKTKSAHADKPARWTVSRPLHHMIVKLSMTTRGLKDFELPRSTSMPLLLLRIGSFSHGTVPCCNHPPSFMDLIGTSHMNVRRPFWLYLCLCRQVGHLIGYCLFMSFSKRKKANTTHACMLRLSRKVFVQRCKSANVLY